MVILHHVHAYQITSDHRQIVVPNAWYVFIHIKNILVCKCILYSCVLIDILDLGISLRFFFFIRLTAIVHQTNHVLLNVAVIHVRDLVVSIQVSYLNLRRNVE